MASPRIRFVGVSALALAGGTVLGLQGAALAAVHMAPAPKPAVAVASAQQDTASASTSASTSASVAAAAPKVSRATVIARAKTWHPHTSKRIPYSQNKTYGGYRTDCSGYASMALKLPKPGPNTVGLASSTYSTKISMRNLKMGDLVIDAIGSNTTRHVVIFEKWANAKHTAYWAYEQRGGYGTDHRTRTYGLSAGSEYKAYRPKNIT